jgi:preprotein translocase subunit SecF
MTRPTGRAGRRRAADAPDDDVRADDLPDTDLPDDELPDGPEDALDDEPADGPDGPDSDARPARGRTSRLDSLYRGNGGLDVVGRSRTWYLLFGAIVLVCVLSMVLRGFNFSIDFVGGTSVQFPARGASGVADTSEVQQVFDQAVGHPAESVQLAGTGSSATIVIQSGQLSQAQQFALDQALFGKFQPLGSSGRPDQNAISDSAVSASWGGEITRQALIALVVFLVLVTAYLAFAFERRMAFAAIVALINDIVVTAGVYSLVGFEVSPATVIGLLTILGFSLYDTVVVFDKVRENTRGLRGLTRRTYAEAANLAVNQTLMRSLNTSLIAALPLIGLFVVGVVLLGVGVLGDLALVQLVGTIIGAASSVLLATPIVVDLAMRDRVWVAQAQRVTARREKNARRAGGGAAGREVTTGEPTDVIDTRAVAAAAGSAGGRNGSGRGTADERSSSGRPGATSGRSGSAPRPGARPAGKTGRPSGKRRR